MKETHTGKIAYHEKKVIFLATDGSKRNASLNGKCEILRAQTHSKSTISRLGA